MNLSTGLILLTLCAVVTLVIRKLIHDKRSGKVCSGCSGNCSSCSCCKH